MRSPWGYQAPAVPGDWRAGAHKLQGWVLDTLPKPSPGSTFPLSTSVALVLDSG